MAYQRYAVNGDLITPFIFINNYILEELGLNKTCLPKGLVGFDMQQGLVEVKLRGDRKTIKMRLGKFLTKSGFTPDKVTYAGKCLNKLKLILSNNYELKFTDSPEEAYRVYKEGPHSCMQGEKSVSVYATEDVAVAYLEVDGKIIARSVVSKNPDKGLRYSTTYGLSTILEEKLQELGYVSGDLDGCRILHIRDGAGIYMPYIDCDCKADEPDEDDEYIYLSTYGTYSCQDQGGYLVMETCNSCGSHEELFYSEHLCEQLCEGCFDSCHANIDGTSYHHDDDRIQELENGDYVLVEDAAYVDYRSDWHLRKDCMYNSFTEEYILKEDIE